MSDSLASAPMPATPGKVPPATDLGRNGTLAWLADAPLLIDRRQVSAFYDAVVRPEGRRGKVTLALEQLQGSETSGKGTVGAEVSVSSWIKTLLPFLDIKGKVEVSAEHKKSSSEKSGESIELFPIDTPHRQLIQLTLHYLANQPHRLKLVTDPLDGAWREEAYILDIPRALVFIDFPPGTKFIPMAAEVEKGHVVLMFENLKAGEASPPQAPAQLQHDGMAGAVRADADAAWAKYWGWFADTFSALASMNVVEQVVGDGGRIEWIDYRVPLEPNRQPLHLHIEGRGRYSTGTFAYQLIARGYFHGLRIVGTLKSEPDLNVLAIFEK